MKWIIPPLILASLSGCTIYQQSKALEEAAKPYVDEAFQEIKGRLCKAPIDILNRQIVTTEDALGAYLLCPDVSGLTDKVTAAKDELLKEPAP